MCSPGITSPKRSVKRRQLNILSILRWALNDKNSASVTYDILTSFYLIIWPTSCPSDLWPAGELWMHRQGMLAKKLHGCWGSDGERKTAASTWTNDTPSIGRGQTKGRWQTRCRMAGVPQRCLFVPEDRGWKIWQSSANTSWRWMWRISVERSNYQERTWCTTGHVWLRVTVQTDQASTDIDGCNRGK